MFCLKDRMHSDPLPETADQPAAPPDAPYAAHVLQVEDAPDLRDTAHQALAMLGYRVVSVGSAEDALTEMDSGTPLDVLITDISLPGKSGLALAEHGAGKHPAVKVIFASGYGESRSTWVSRAGACPSPTIWSACKNCCPPFWPAEAAQGRRGPVHRAGLVHVLDSGVCCVVANIRHPMCARG
ncbi:MAG: hybrid sensor histidine kinase/response regulator [Polaromonas sp.]|nr:hybrid sensor histidine kinase/response regulator [Polaromonas sp.]